MAKTVHIPDDLHKKASYRAIDDNCDIQDVVSLALIRYLKISDKIKDRIEKEK